MVSYRRQARVEIPGATAAFRVTEPRPTFSVRGLSPETGLYLVRSRQREDYREVRVTIPRDIFRWTQFRRSDLSAIDVDPLGADAVRVRPRADLSPGEYFLITDMASRYRAFQVAAAFSVGR